MADVSKPRQRVLVRASLVALAATGLAAGLLFVATVPPTDQSIYPKCLSYRLAGIHCPGCGTTRALHSALNGELAQACAYNPLAVLVLPYVLFSIGRSTWSYLWHGRWARTLLWPPKLMWSFAFLVIVYWVLRNVPVYPFTLLAPHELSP